MTGLVVGFEAAELVALGAIIGLLSEIIRIYRGWQ